MVDSYPRVGVLTKRVYTWRCSVVMWGRPLEHSNKAQCMLYHHFIRILVPLQFELKFKCSTMVWRCTTAKEWLGMAKEWGLWSACRVHAHKHIVTRHWERTPSKRNQGLLHGLKCGHISHFAFRMRNAPKPLMCVQYHPRVGVLGVSAHGDVVG